MHYFEGSEPGYVRRNHYGIRFKIKADKESKLGWFSWRTIILEATTVIVYLGLITTLLSYFVTIFLGDLSRNYSRAVFESSDVALDASRSIPTKALVAAASYFQLMELMCWQFGIDPADSEAVRNVKISEIMMKNVLSKFLL